MDEYYDFPPEFALDPDLRLRPLGYLERRRTIRVRRIPIPRHLFRYGAVFPNDAQNVDRLRDVVVRSRLWLSSPSAFNDPFDSKHFIRIPDDVGTIRGAFAKMIREREPKLGYIKRKQRLEQMAMNPAMRPSGLREVVDSAQERVISQYGVACFSETARNILMWSHYAAQHRGICLMFETSRDVKVWFRAMAIVYSDRYPVLEWRGPVSEDSSKVIVWKFKDWAYERERRIVALNAANRFLQFNGDSLTGIILGCRADQAVVDTVRALAEERRVAGLPPLKVFRAVQSEKRYGLNIRKEISKTGT